MHEGNVAEIKMRGTKIVKRATMRTRKNKENGEEEEECNQEKNKRENRDSASVSSS